MDGSIKTANEIFLRTMGYRLAEVQGRHHSMFVDDAMRESAEYREFWTRLSREVFQAGEFKRLAKGGREVWLQATYNPIRDQSGKPVRVVKLASDVTESVLERHQVRERERQTYADLSSVIVEAIQAADQRNGGAQSIAESSANLSDSSQSLAASVEQMTGASGRTGAGIFRSC